LAVASALVALESLIQETPSMISISSWRCGRPGKLRRQAAMTGASMLIARQVA